MVGYSLAYKYKTRVEVNGSGKHSNLLQDGNNYVCKIRNGHDKHLCSIYSSDNQRKKFYNV
jgi:hypothetical protein